MQKSQQHPHVVHPMNTAGTTWLRESDLVFIERRPYAVLRWSAGKEPDLCIPLDEQKLKHDLKDEAMYRYDGETEDPLPSAH